MKLKVDQSLPLLILSIVFFVGLFFNDLFYNLLTKLGVCEKEEEDEVDE